MSTTDYFIPPHPLKSENPRLSTDICLLCQKNVADQKNSHIIPRFLTEQFFESGKIGIETIYEAKTGIQSTGTEDYILCTSCESKISVIEKEFNDSFYAKFKEPATGTGFRSLLPTQIDGILHAKVFDVDPAVFGLFFYSIIWRLSVCTISLFKDFHLDKHDEELFRSYLNSYLDSDIKVVKSRPKTQLPFYFSVMTSFDPPVAFDQKLIMIKMYHTPDRTHSHSFFLGEMCINLFPSQPNEAAEYANNGVEDCIFFYVPTLTWNNEIATLREKYSRRIANLSLRNILEQGGNHPGMTFEKLINKFIKLPRENRGNKKQQ